jgi:hypothetical protein
VGRYAKWPFSVSVAAVAASFFCVVLVCATLTFSGAKKTPFFWVVLAHCYSHYAVLRYATALLAAKKAKKPLKSAVA